MLDRLPAAQRKAILDNVVSEEPEVTAVVGKLTQGAADAGFVYVTDAKAAGKELKTIRIPASLQPDVAYGVAIVKDAANPSLAKKFVAGLFAPGAGATDLREAGFLPPAVTRGGRVQGADRPRPRPGAHLPHPAAGRGLHRTAGRAGCSTASPSPPPARRSGSACGPR